MKVEGNILLGDLTDQRIDEYVLQGRYGPAARADFIARIKNNRKDYVGLLRKIRLGHYGQELKSQFPKQKRTKKVQTTIDWSIIDLDDIFK